MITNHLESHNLHTQTIQQKELYNQATRLDNETKNKFQNY